MPLRRSLAAATAAAVALNTAVVAAANMETKNAMPSVSDGECEKQACEQGVLFANAMSFSDTFDSPVFSYAFGVDFGGPGWPAGPVSADDAYDLYEYGDELCQLKLRGVTILRIMNAMVGSLWLTGSNDDATDAQLLQYNNVRVKYSTTLPATNRLLSVEAKDPATGEYKPVDRTALYTVNTLEYDYRDYEPYNTWTEFPSLTGEGVSCGDVKYLAGQLVENFLKPNSPYTIPNVSQALTSEAGGTAMVVEQDAAICKAMTPPQVYHPGLASCDPCPPGTTSTGSDCVAAATAAPVTPAPATPTPITPAPVTLAPVTAAPVSTAPVTAAPSAAPTAAPSAAPTAAPVVPSGSATAALASIQSASSAAGSTGAVTATPDAPTSAPATTGTGTAAGAAGGAAAPSSGSSTGLIIGIVVGVVALIVAAIVGFVVTRNRASGATTTSDGLDSRLEPPDYDAEKAGSKTNII